MNDLPDKCRVTDCAAARTQFSVFCDAHHRMGLVSVGLLPMGPVDSGGAMRRRVERDLEAYARKAIDLKELVNALFDRFVSEQIAVWDAGLDLLLPEITSKLLKLVERHQSQPRLFYPLPDDPRRLLAAVTAAFIAQEELIARLQERLGRASGETA